MQSLLTTPDMHGPEKMRRNTSQIDWRGGGFSRRSAAPARRSSPARAAASERGCPLCGRLSRRVHSRYVRTVSDLPFAGKRVDLRLIVRRFVCEASLCRRRIFAERFNADIVAAWSRRTARLDCIVHHLGLALGGRPGSTFAKRLMLPVSNDTLLRTVRRRAQRPADPLRVVGVDDWAFRRNHRYGSIVCDLERHRPVTLLPNHEEAKAVTWLRERPGPARVTNAEWATLSTAAGKALIFSPAYAADSIDSCCK